MSQRTRRIYPILLALTVAILATQAFAEEIGRCYYASIPGVVVLPDGSTHEASNQDEGVPLRVCYERSLSPVSALHTAYVDRLPVGRFISHRFSAEGSDPQGRPAYFIFIKATGDKNLLAFQGYVARDYDRLVSHDLSGVKGKDRTTSRWELANLEADELQDNWVFVAARSQ